MKNTRKPTKDDYQKYCGLLGGKIEDLPKPHIFKWPTSTEPRVIRVRITSYVGWSFGAKHYTARVEEEKNPVWNGETWCEPWESYKLEGCNGRQEETRHLSRDAANKSIKRILKKWKVLDNPAYKIENDSGDDIRAQIILYGKIGD